MTRQDFENVLKIGEHVGVEFKRGGNGAKNDTFETICAFLNRFGGNIFLGVTGDGEVVGYLLIHREYSSSRPARLVIERGVLFADNANKALHHGSITPENLDPQPKNPIIANFFHQIGRADELGSGVRNPFHYTKQYSGATIPQLQECLGMSRNGVKKALERLKTSGVIRRVGPDKGGHWEIIGTD